MPVRCGVLTLIAAASALAQSRIYLAYDESDRTGCVFLGWFDRDGFVRDPELSTDDPERYVGAAVNAVKAFPNGRTLFGIDRFGKRSRASVVETYIGPGLGTYAITVDRDRRGIVESVLLSTAPLSIEVLRPRAAKLTPRIEAQIAIEAKSLWAKALTEKHPDDPTKHFFLQPPDVLQVAEAPEMLAIYYPVLAQYEVDSFDDRGSMFFLYSLAENRIVYSTFGHPEWSNGATTTIVKPDIFFRVKGGKAVYFVGSHVGGWEEWGNAIYDLRTGRLVLFCY